MPEKEVDLSVRLGKLLLRNPVMPSSGTFGYGELQSDFVDLNALGAIVTKGTSLKPRMGNSEHRFAEVSCCASLISIGLQNIGVQGFISRKLPYLRQFATPVIVNIVGDAIGDYVRLAEILGGTEGIAGLELNMTCPNVEKGGKRFSADPETSFTLVRAVREATDLTLIAKVSPSAAPIDALAKACEEAGADALCPNYSVMGMAIDIDKRRSRLGDKLAGGVGGPWRKPIAVYMAWQAAQATSLPVIGCGGITGAKDALEFLIAGASAIEIGTYNLVNPRVTVETVEGLRQYMIEKGYQSLKEIVGTIEPSGHQC